MLMRAAVLVSTGLTAMLTPPANTQTVTAGLKNGVLFTEYSALSTRTELVRRLFSPLSALRVNQEVARAGTTLRGQPIDLASERFSIYVPAHPHPPPHGYSLLVFVPPWSRAEAPSQWIPALDRHDMILVTPANSGNDANTVDRREPLVLLAAQNAMAQYPVDPQQVYIGGFSGGSRVALRLALGYPDLFRGAILNAGSDTIGTAELPLPPRDLLLEFQSAVHLVYVTGERDEPHVSDDLLSVRSMRRWCMFNVTSFLQPRAGHEVA